MLEQTSEKFRANFLLRLTKEIIENTKSYMVPEKKGVGLTLIKEPIEKKAEEASKETKKEEIRALISGNIKKETEKISEMRKKDLLSELKMMSDLRRPIQISTKNMFSRGFNPPLIIPEPNLPETVQYVKPVPTTEEIDLGRLNILVRDPLVKVIECNIPGENILVMGIMGRKMTPIKMDKDEIRGVVEKFSEATKIPLNEGLFKAAVGNLVISAVVSDIVGIKFVIRKIAQEI